MSSSEEPLDEAIDSGNESPDPPWDPVSQEPLDPQWRGQGEDGEENFVIKDILDYAWSKDLQAYEFWIKWKGWGPKHNSWEPIELFSEPYEARLHPFMRKHKTLMDFYVGQEQHPDFYDSSGKTKKQKKATKENKKRKRASIDATKPKQKKVMKGFRSTSPESDIRVPTDNEDTPRRLKAKLSQEEVIQQIEERTRRKYAGPEFEDEGAFSDTPVSKPHAAPAQSEPGPSRRQRPPTSEDQGPAPPRKKKKRKMEASKPVQLASEEHSDDEQPLSATVQQRYPNRRGSITNLTQPTNAELMKRTGQEIAAQIRSTLEAQKAQASAKKVAATGEASISASPTKPASPQKLNQPPKAASSPKIAQRNLASPEVDRARSSVTPASPIDSRSEQSADRASPELVQPLKPAQSPKQPPRPAAKTAKEQKEGDAQESWRHYQMTHAREKAPAFETTHNDASWLLDRLRGTVYLSAKTPMEAPAHDIVARIWNVMHQPAKEGSEPLESVASSLREFVETMPSNGTSRRAYIQASRYETVGQQLADEATKNDVHALSYALQATGVKRIAALPEPEDLLDDPDAAKLTIFVHHNDVKRLHLLHKLRNFRGEQDPVFATFGQNAGTRLLFVDEAVVTLHSSVILEHPDLLARATSTQRLHLWLHPGILASDGPLSRGDEEEQRHAHRQITLAVTQASRPLHVLEPRLKAQDPKSTSIVDRLNGGFGFPRPCDKVNLEHLKYQLPLSHQPMRELLNLIAICKEYMPRYLAIRRWLVVTDDALSIEANSGDPDEVDDRLGPAEVISCSDFIECFVG